MPSKVKPITDEIRKIFLERYKVDFATGELSWRIPGTGRRIGLFWANIINSETVRIKSVVFSVHRLIFSAYYGRDIREGFFITHKNGVQNDNRIANLKETESKGCGSGYTNNTSGHTGVSWDKNKNLWKSRISIDGKRIYLGNFKTKEEAIEARIAAEVKHGYHQTHDR